MSCYVSIKNQSGKYKQYKVKYEVYIYIKQLENYIKHQEMSKLKGVYSERFRKDKI